MYKRFIAALILFTLMVSGGGTWAAVAIDTSATATAFSSPATLTLNTSGAKRLIVLAINYNSTTAISTAPSGGGLTWTLTKAQNCGSSVTGRIEVWQAFAAATVSSQTITVTLPGTLNSAILMDAFSGVDVSTPIEASAVLAQPTGGGTTQNSATVTTLSNNAYVASYAMVVGSTLAAGTGYTQTSSATNPASIFGIGEFANSVTATSGTAVTPTWSSGTTHAAAFISLSIKSFVTVAAIKAHGFVVTF